MPPRDHAGQNVTYAFFVPLNNANDGLFEALCYIEMFHAGLLYGWFIPVGIGLGYGLRLISALWRYPLRSA